jgi:hypothetical protein
MGVTAEPDVLEVVLAAFLHLESIHGDEHFVFFSGDVYNRPRAWTHVLKES